MNIAFNTSSRFTILAALLFAVFCVPALPAADEAASDGTPVGIIPVPDKLAIADVKACVSRAFINRKYQIQKSEQGLIVGYYERSPNVLTLTVRYDTKEVKLFAKGSSRGGGLPTRWIESYRKDVGSFLSQKLLEK
ncbi:hypothetical protein OH491_25015 [Termitidicoccus mucosus]|uniref:DUF1499 domain-containing protein n=1 Tax=Termitidicoccus mucosus TaxID=1184151 RepID=A0A178IPU6_9BACT|nr:hypothetical protein AW736_01530 [Opitutaceae bacterium TSB47]